MKTKILIKTTVSAIIFASICAIAALSVPYQSADTQTARWYSIIPPLLTIVLAFLTRNVLLSIAVAIITGGLLTTMPSDPTSVNEILAGLRTTVSYPIDTLTNIENLKILAFVPPIFVMVEIIIVSGGFTAILQKILPRIKTKKSAQAATALMGLVYFIDDYSNAVIVGSAMQPVTDRFGISREKLAFLVDATSAPITSLAVVSTWIAYEVGLFALTAQKLGIEKDGYSMFFDALTFRFYCIMMLSFVFLHILFGCDFGPMKKAQNKASRNLPLDNDVTEPTNSTDVKHPANILNALVPLAGLVSFHIVGLWFDGGGPANITSFSSMFHWQYWRQVIGGTENSILILIYASLFGLTLAVLCSILTQSLRFSDIIKCVIIGFKKCFIPCLILISAWSLKNCCDSLNTDRFLTNLLSDNVSPLFFPAIVFLQLHSPQVRVGGQWQSLYPLPFPLPLHSMETLTVWQRQSHSEPFWTAQSSVTTAPPSLTRL